MSLTNYELALDALLLEIRKRYPARVTSRRLVHLSESGPADEDLLAGRYTALSFGVRDYDRATSESDTDMAAQVIVLLFQVYVPPKGSDVETDNLDIDRAEFEAVQEVESLLANMGIGLPENLQSLSLERFSQSGQMESPFGWVSFEFINRS